MVWRMMWASSSPGSGVFERERVVSTSREGGRDGKEELYRDEREIAIVVLLGPEGGRKADLIVRLRSERGSMAQLDLEWRTQEVGARRWTRSFSSEFDRPRSYVKIEVEERRLSTGILSKQNWLARRVVLVEVEFQEEGEVEARWPEGEGASSTQPCRFCQHFELVGEMYGF